MVHPLLDQVGPTPLRHLGMYCFLRSGDWWSCRRCRTCTAWSLPTAPERCGRQQRARDMRHSIARDLALGAMARRPSRTGFSTFARSYHRCDPGHHTHTTNWNLIHYYAQNKSIAWKCVHRSCCFWLCITRVFHDPRGDYTEPKQLISWAEQCYVIPK